MESGNPCPTCKLGFMLTYRTIRPKKGECGVRYLKCTNCGATGRMAVRLAPRRKSRRHVTRLVTSRLECPLCGGTIRSRRGQSRRAKPEVSMMLNAGQLARSLKIDHPRLVQLVAGGFVPFPCVSMGIARWWPQDIEAWVAAGTPRQKPPAWREFMEMIRLLKIEAGDYRPIYVAEDHFDRLPAE